jgi:Pyruvate/2-oxoacid:ferredoxin oxidoreductase gamma subunit
MILLGALIEISKIVPPLAIQKAIRVHVSERFRSLNLKAIRMGRELGREVRG